jgi:predicted neutral ceramidase superfamily lipid hydrolase
MNTFSIGNVFKAGLIGGIVAGVLNFGVYFIGAALGAKYMGDNGTGGLELIVSYRALYMSVIFAMVGAAVFAALIKLAPNKAWTVFLVLSVLFFLSMIPGPFLVVHNDVAASISLEVMHIVGAVCVVGAMQRFGRTTTA